MYHSKHNPLRKVKYKNDTVYTATTVEQRRLQKAILRYHDEKLWSLLREALIKMKRTELLGDGDKALIPNDKRNSKTTQHNKTRNKNHRHTFKGR